MFQIVIGLTVRDLVVLNVKLATISPRHVVTYVRLVVCPVQTPLAVLNAIREVTVVRASQSAKTLAWIVPIQHSVQTVFRDDMVLHVTFLVLWGVKA